MKGDNIMLINDTSLLTEETKQKLNEMGLVHINTGGHTLTEELALELIECIESRNNKTKK